MSLEQEPAFHLVRRIARAVAPGVEVVTTEELEDDASVFDASVPRIEVSEKTSLDRAVSSACFELGHARLLNEPRFSVFFGRGILSRKGRETELIEELSKLGAEVDQLAASWAREAIDLFFPNWPHALVDIDARKWTEREWRDYFST